MTASRTTFFERLGRWVVGHPWRVVGGWLALVVVAIALMPALATRVDPNTSGTLPSSAEASKATSLAQAAFPGRPQSTGVIVFTRTDGGALTDADSKQVTAVVGSLKSAGVAGVRTVTTSERQLAPNHKSQLGQIAFAENANDKKTVDAVKALRSKTAVLLNGTSLAAGYSGEAPVAADNTDAIAAAAGIVAGATVGLIVILQLLIFRSPVAAFVPVVAVGLVQVVGGGLAGAVSALFGYKVASFAPILVIVVLFGVGTDYILFLLFRYRERLREGEDPKEALVHALARVGEAVTSAAGVVIVAFCTLLVSPLGSFRTLGPTLAVVVAAMLAAGLTLVPAIVALLGERIFWPSKAWRTAGSGTFAPGLGRLTARRPGLLAAGCALLFGVLALGAVGFSLDYDPVGQLPQDKESATSYNRMLQDFPPGNLAPVVVFLTHDGTAPLDADGEQAFGAALKGVAGVASVAPAVASADGGTAQFTVILNQDPYSKAALALVSGPLADAAHTKAPSGTHAFVGGPSSAYAGIRDANSDGLRLALPIAAVLIGLILALLLRGVLGTGLLIGVVFLGFGGVFGSSVLLFQHAQGKPGLQFVIPLVMYVFVVAIGTDYNILMISRIRDEIRSGAGAREAVGAAVARTAPAVAAAGLVLAGSFAALMLAGIGFLTEMGFAVSLGIALCAFVMAILLVPGLVAVTGDRFWWPSRPAAPASVPETTNWSAAFRLATHTSWAALCASLTSWSASVADRPIKTAMVPGRSRVAASMARPRATTRRVASVSERISAAASAEYSPRLCPAQAIGDTVAPAVRSASTMTISSANVASWATSVCFSVSASASSNKAPTSRPAISEICSTNRHEWFSRHGKPMPGRCAPWPGNTQAVASPSSDCASSSIRRYRLRDARSRRRRGSQPAAPT